MIIGGNYRYGNSQLFLMRCDVHYAVSKTLGPIAFTKVDRLSYEGAQSTWLSTEEGKRER